MKKSIATEAGFLLSYALETLNLKKVLHPFYTTIFNGEKRIQEFKDLSYEKSIPKTIDAFHANSSDADAGIAIYPAEIEQEGKRTALIVIMVKEYNSDWYLTIGQHYEKREDMHIPTLYELLDFSFFLSEELRELESSFLQGIEAYNTVQA